ncbi:MAG: VCBS repeat-containing protein [Verrucomicrobiota bacterium]
MKSSLMGRIHQSPFLWAAGATLGLLVLSTAGAQASGSTNRFGFAGPEIFPIDQQFGQIRAADLDGDGLQDLVVVNNSRSKINLLYNQTGKPRKAIKIETPLKREPNELPPDARFRMDSIASEKRIASLVVADLNSDGKPDIAYYGEPKELIVQYNLGANGWSPLKRWPIDDGQLSPNAMVHGDVNGDGRDDLILLGETTLYVLHQNADKQLDEPEKVPFSGSVKAVQVLDINGDGRQDLLLVNWDNPNPFRFRLQNTVGQLDPEIHFSFPPIRSYWADDLDNDRRTEVLTVAQNSGRAQLSTFKQKTAEPLLGTLKQGQFQVLPLKKTDKARRGVVWADINRDLRDDLIVAEPNSGQISVYLQEANGLLAAPRSFPTLTGVSDLAAADWDGDGSAELFLLSSDERQVGVTRMDTNGRVPFPEIISVEGKPLAMAVGPLEANGKPKLALVIDQDGKRTLQIRSAKGEPKSQKLDDSFKGNPASLSIHDLDQDGKPDLIILIPYEKIKILRQSGELAFDEFDLAPPGGTLEQPWLSTLDVDGDGKGELLLAQKNFLRAVVARKDGDAGPKGGWQLHVKEQINGAANNSRITGAAAIPGGNGKTATLFLLDAERKAVSVCERDAAGVWQTVRNLQLPVMEFTGLQPIGLNGPRSNSIAFLGLNTVAWMTFSGQVWELAELDGYETPIKDGYLMDVVSGDLNNDGRKDLVFLETAKNHLDIVTYEAPHSLVPANRWQVFEERTFRSRRGNSPEPREAIIVDLTGDGKNDLAVVVHDRVLVYPQD